MDGEAMINCIKNGDQPLPRVTQVSIAGTSSTEQPPLKDKSMWSDQEKKIQKIDRLARSLMIQGLPNDIYSLIDSNKTAKDLWDALTRHMLGSEYGEQDRKVAVLYEYETFKATEGELLLDTYIRYLQSDDKKVEKKDDEKKQYMSKVKCYNCKKEGHFAKDCKKAKVKDYEYYKTKMLLVKKDKDKQVLLAEDHAWMESEASLSSADDKIFEVSYYLSESENESEYETSDYYDNITTYGLFVNDNDDQEIFHDCKKFPQNLIESQIDHNESAVDHNDSKGIDKLIRKFNKMIDKCLKRIEKANHQNKDFENQNKDLQDKYDVLKNQATTFEMKNKELNEQMKVLIEKNDDLIAQTNINFLDDYFQEIINPYFEKIDSPFQQTSSLKPYVPNVILEKIIIDLEDEVVSLLDKEKENLKIIESLKSKYVETCVESSEKVVSETENKSENDCQVIEKVCDSEENPNVIAPRMFKLNTLSSVRRPKPGGVMWMKKGSSNTVKADLSFVNHSNVNKNVKRYSHKNLTACNNSNIRSAFDCNNARNALCNARMNASVDGMICLFLMMWVLENLMLARSLSGKSLVLL
uniref:CCHC-type domain-containing protein n=1 Tax=Tanacetum cinerariifolium TaxID=118510 RepID=A0A6L2NEK7_TANCI|nr:hypothetical protein [Tanacetum cinerariifolium]